MTEDKRKKGEREYRCPATNLTEFDIFQYIQMQSDPSWADTMKKIEIEKINNHLPKHLEICLQCRSIYNEIISVDNVLRNFSKSAKFLYINE